jgi:hypothetical protein
MLRVARHAMLFLSVVAILAVLLIVRGLQQIEVYELSKLPIASMNINERINEMNDLASLKKVCSLVADAMDKAASKRQEQNNELALLVRKGLKLALGFSVASAVVLLLGWVAAGACIRKQT